MVVIQLG